MNEIHRKTSQNGRYGLAVVSQTDLSLREPQEGSLVALGTIEGHKTYRFDPLPGCGQWVLLGRDFRPLAGAEVAFATDLQGGKAVTLLIGGGFFVIESYGYQRRSSEIHAYQDGRRIDLPASVLMSMGILAPTSPPEAVKPPPPLDSSLAQALAKAGLG